MTEKVGFHARRLAPNTGMLFVYPQEMPLRFYMKNTYKLLDIAFIDENGRILNIEPDTQDGNCHCLRGLPIRARNRPGLFYRED
ncbi:MAG: DUF192 domain-containing protein [Desulfobacterales bacterium]